MKLYLITSLHTGYDKMVLGDLVPNIQKSYEAALSNAKAGIEDLDFEGTIYDDVTKTIFTYEGNGEWDEDPVDDITDEDLYEAADNYDAVYITEVEYDL